jgi:ABC-type phosphate transport system substrate-binding protein
MKGILLIFVFLGVLLSAKNYAIISNGSIKQITLTQIQALYLKKMKYIQNYKAVPVNLSSRDAIRRSFEKNILNMSLSRLKIYWSREHYKGHRPPVTFKSQESVKAFVKKVNGSIAYIELKNIDKDLSILYTWSDE